MDEDRKKVVAYINKKAGGDLSEIAFPEYRIVRSDGSIRWILSRAFPIHDESGEVYRIAGIALDITERKLAEEEIVKAKEDWEQTFNAVPDLIAILNDRYRIVRVNKAMADRLGVTPEEAIGLTCYEQVHGTKEPPPFCPHSKLLADGHEHSTEVHEERLGGDFFLTVSPIKGPDDHATGCVHVARDITERKQTEQALRESEERFRDLAELLPETIFEMDVQGRLTFVNQRAFDQFKYTKEDFDRGLNCLDMIDPVDRPRAMENITKILGQEEIGLNEYTAVRKDDSTFPALFHSSAIFKGGKPIGLRGFIIDIAEKKLLEDQLQQTHKMESIGTLAGGIAHDFNNILGIIVGNTELALDDVPEWNPAHQNLEEVQKACLRARDVVKQILAFSRQSERMLKPVKIAPIIKESLMLVRSSIPTTVEIRHNFSCESDTINADLTQINQILINLCTNASHAMRGEGGVLEVGLKNVELDKDTTTLYPELTPGNYVKLTISDTGHGIDTEIIDRIFDPYFTTKEVGEGTGMGLAVVHGIVKTHRGAISVDSESGRGTTFQILFPCISKDIEPTEETLEEISKGSETVLFIDDEKKIVNVSKQMLTRLGYKVVGEENPIKALEIFKDRPERFDVIITDMTMPNMTGVKLAQVMMEIRSDIPIILCTGYSEKISEEKAAEIGIKAFVMKPIAMREVATTIREVLEKNG